MRQAGIRELPLRFCDGAGLLRCPRTPSSAVDCLGFQTVSPRRTLRARRRCTGMPVCSATAVPSVVRPPRLNPFSPQAGHGVSPLIARSRARALSGRDHPTHPMPRALPWAFELCPCGAYEPVVINPLQTARNPKKWTTLRSRQRLARPNPISPSAAQRVRL